MTVMHLGGRAVRSGLPALGLLLAACREQSRPSTATAATAATSAATAPAAPPGFVVRAHVVNDASTRLCGVIATGTRAPVSFSEDLADTVGDRLAPRVLEGTGVRGVRWIAPGVEAVYRFEGVSRDGGWRVSVTRPVTTRPGVRVPVGAADSVIEAALTPDPRMFDDAVQAYAPPAGAPPRTIDPHATPAPASAVRVFAELARFEARLSEACPDVVLRLPMIARIDQRIRVPVRAGDRVSAHATTEAGAVRVAFEEAGPLPTAPRLSTVPQAEVVAAADGVVTLRVMLEVVVKQQRADQDVLVRLARR